jgi:hypothetical protein
MNGNGDALFNLVGQGLSAEERSEFLQALREASITGHDAELAKLLRALQLYKGYYDSIPAAVQAAADRIEQVRQEIAVLSERTAQNAESVSQLAGQLILEAGQIQRSLASVDTAVEEVIHESAGQLASQISDLVRGRIEDTVVTLARESLLQVASAAGELNEAARRSTETAATLRQEPRSARRTHIAAYALTAMIVAAVLSLASWFSLHRWYSLRIDEERVALIQQTEKHRAILLKLARSNKTLELVQNPKRPRQYFLVMKNASGWQSSSGQGVIEFRE